MQATVKPADFNLLNNQQYLEYEQALQPEGDLPPLRLQDDNFNEPIYEGASQTYAETNTDWQVLISDEHRVGHEAHFAQVTEQYLQYLVDGEIPEWERKNMLTKYYLTTQAYKKSR